MADPQNVPAEKERVLRALVLADGKPSKAREALKAQDVDVPLRTIQQWRNEYAARYEWLEQNQRKWVSREVAKQARRAGQTYGAEAQRLAQSIGRLTDEQLDQVTIGSKANAIRALETARGISFTKAEELDKAATDTVEKREESMDQIMRGFERFFSENKLQNAKLPAELVPATDE